MNTRHVLKGIASVAVVTVSLFGAGCGSSVATPTATPSGPKTSTFDGLTPAQAAEKINFVPGTVVELRQTFLGFGAELAAKLAGEGKEGTRVIVISRFAPMEVANLNWKLTSKVEADSSVIARAAARKANKTEPEPVMVDRVAEGGVGGMNLRDGHSLYLPSFWPEKDAAPSFGTSGIWLSNDVYEGLSRNRVSTLDFGVLNSDVTTVISKLTDFKTAFDALVTKKKAIEDHIDVFRLDGDAGTVDWPLTVNGQKITVAAIKAHTWFGEIVVLQNKQNPLVLKATLNPATFAIADLTSGLGLLNTLVGYQVTEIKDAQE